MEGNPKVFIIAGNGTGTAVFRRLQRERIPFAAGILWENDLDYPSARALAVRTVSVPAFRQISPGALEEAKGLIDSCDSVLCPLEPLETEAGTEMAAGLPELLAYARSSGKIRTELP